MITSRVFVSHSHHDNAYCREFVMSLRAQGFAVWYDEHNLGWGALRPTIETEMAQSQHFIAILSPAAVASQWVNAEIDAALDLLGQGALRSFAFVIAQRCETPLLLRRWKRIEGSDGAPMSAQTAALRAATILASEAGLQRTYAPTSAPSSSPVRSERRLLRMIVAGVLVAVGLVLVAFGLVNHFARLIFVQHASIYISALGLITCFTGLAIMLARKSKVALS